MTTPKRRSKTGSRARSSTVTNTERERVSAQAGGKQAWRRWGPYLSERQWGTVREDYSPHGEAWEDFSHDQARSCAYRSCNGVQTADKSCGLSVRNPLARRLIVKSRF
jgi:hypothetical protein